MVNANLGTDANLRDLLAARARSTSDGYLVADVAGGLVAALGFAWWHPYAWPILISAAVSLAAFGAWGVADREITERSAVDGARWVAGLAVIRGVAVATGALAAGIGALSTLALLLGTWIS